VPILVDPNVMADEIAVWLVTHQVTRCPTAAVEATTATVSAEDVQALKQYHEAMDRQWNAKSMKTAP
jgi:hypothetical protein